MSNDPLVSICIPLYNKKDYLAKTVEAVLAQTYPNIEVVLSDNGSTDGSGAIAQEIARRDPRIRYFRLESTVNINESWRYCLSLAQGDFIKLHSADDTSLAVDYLRRMVDPMLRQPELEFTVCAIKPVMQYTETGYSGEGQANYHQRVAQLNREVTALPTRELRARKLLETASLHNWAGTPYAIVCRRSCLPQSHWRKTSTVFAWPEAYPDWDFNIRLLLNHRGLFVEGIASLMYYDAKNAYIRSIVNNSFDLFDLFCQTLVTLNVLIDPELSALRLQAQPADLAFLFQNVQERIQMMMNLADEVAAFDHPHFTAKILPRLYQYVETYRSNPQDWIASRRLRQLRLCLVQHWLNTPAEHIQQEYYADPGRAHNLLVASGLRRAHLDIREKELLEKTHAELAEGLAPPASWGRWLALVLLTSFQGRPALTPDMVPDWLRADFAKYAWAAF